MPVLTITLKNAISDKFEFISINNINESLIFSFVGRNILMTAGLVEFVGRNDMADSGLVEFVGRNQILGNPAVSRGVYYFDRMHGL